MTNKRNLFKMHFLAVAVLGACCAALAQDQSTPLGDVVRRPKTTAKAKVTLVEEGSPRPAPPASGKEASADAPKGQGLTPDKSPAPPTLDTDKTAKPLGSATDSPAQTAARQKLAQLKDDEGKLTAQINSLQHNLITETNSDLRGAYQQMLFQDQSDLESDKQEEAKLQKTLQPQE